MNTGLFVLGIALLVLGLIMFGYSRSTDGFYFAPPNSDYERPYAPIGVVVSILGLVLMIASVMVPVTTQRTVTNTEVMEHPKKKTVVREEKL